MREYDHKLHAVVIAELNEQFPNASIFVGSVRRDTNGSIIASNVKMALPNTKPRQQVFSAQRVVVRGKLDITDWVQQLVLVKEVELFGLELDVWPTGENTWSLNALQPNCEKRKTPPKLILRDAVVRLRRSSHDDKNLVLFNRVSGTITPEEVLNFDPAFRNPSRISLKAEAAGAIDTLTCEARTDPNNNSWLANCSITNFQLSPSLIARLPTSISNSLNQLKALHANASAEIEIHSRPNQLPLFRMAGSLKSGHLQDPRLPYPLENMQVTFRANNESIELRELSAECGTAQISLNCYVAGHSLKSPMQIDAQATHLQLDPRLRSCLPANLQEQWDKLQVSGAVSGQARLTFDGQKWTPTLSANCEGVSLRPWLFPYPLSDLHGKVTYQSSRISSPQMTGQAAGQRITGNFSLEKLLADEWIGHLECQAHGPVPINEQLIASLTPRDREQTGAEAFVRTLRPAGTIHLSSARFQRSSVDDQWHKMIDANIHSGSITYEGFKYPIYDISGRIFGADDQWQLDQFEGRNDSARIKCWGGWQNVASGSLPLDLNFVAYAVPTEEQLKQALPSEAQFVWDELRPSGSIDEVLVRIHRPRPDLAVTTTVQVLEDSKSNATEGRSLRIHPKTFPYELKDVDCKINYTPGLVIIEQASGDNGASHIALEGVCQPMLNGRWKADIQWLPTTRLRVESELLKALPKSIRESLVKVDFRGPISVLGRSEIVFSNRADVDLSTAWDCQLAVEDCQLGDGRNIGALRGTIQIQGRSDGANIIANGSLDMDALTVRGIPITRLNGPFKLIGSNLFFGDRVSEAMPQVNSDQPTTMTANALSGKLYLSGQGLLNIGKFYLDAQLRSADLNLLLKDLGVDNSTTEAVCDADLSFNGVPWNTQSYDGSGRIQLSDAKLYQLPFMIRLLRVASVNANDDSAFQTADIQFDIVGNRIPLKVACDGDVLRLRGEGETNLQRDLRLDLYSYVGRNPLASAVSPLLSESRYSTFMLIQVDGTLDNPNMQRRAFPQLEATFQQMFPELANSNSEAILPWRR